MIRRLIALLLALMSLTATAGPAWAERVKDLGSFQGIRSNQLTGYGIVVGLPGTGDDNLEYTVQSMKAVASRFGLQLPAGINPALKNAAAVLVTAELPAFAKPGQRIDVTVAALGRAKSLRGGALILTPLQGADGQIYAMAQGNLAVGGLGADGADGSKIVVNIPSSGRIPEGASVERAVDTGFDTSPVMTFNLMRADFTTAQSVAAAINARLGPGRAQAVDAVSIAISAPGGADVRAQLMSAIENLVVTPAEPAARVIVNARTGTVVINSAVRLGPAAVTQGKLTVRVDESQRISQPAPFSQGQTAVEQRSGVSVGEEVKPVFLLAPGPKLADVVKAMNAIGASPADLVAILEALKEAGALKAELVIL
ncbi:MAG: flagellar basal body P-ring protein FlgI [Sphingomonas sp.]|jgi:flagellar P-ring protein FlgI|uniref:flagellar basal body P-ring protein FlgI n=1 Tax=Sphingomonas sp. TaxID=28214 RepID=UPI0025F083D4|nr:flagellar basal body P-ring protein FlgI [Sphingomonas sp.]MBX9882458.1 flagellar basal body P-ring protein FlgI [Sphingomonas sp.]